MSYGRRPSGDRPGSPWDSTAVRKAIEKTLRVAKGFQDEYRDAAIKYHMTQMPARDPQHMSEERIFALKTMFETSTIGQYHAVFAELYKIQETAFSLGDKYVRYPGTGEELYHRVFFELKPAIAALDEEYQAFGKHFMEKVADAEKLMDISRKLYEMDEAGSWHAWQDPIMAGWSIIHPRQQGEEWHKFWALVSSLPDTQRAMEIECARDFVLRA